MSFADFVHSLRRGWALVLAGLVAGLALGLTLSAISRPAYSARSVVLLSPTNDGGQSTLIGIAPTYAQLATMSAVLSPAAQEIGYEGGAPAMARHVSAVTPPATALVQIEATDTDPARAAAVAAATSKQFTTFLATSPQTRRQVVAQLVESAVVPREPSSTSRSKLLVSSIVLGLGLGVVAAMLRQALVDASVSASGRTHTAEPGRGASLATPA